MNVHAESCSKAMQLCLEGQTQQCSCCGVQAGVAMASAGELSFNWSGFISAMVSNLTFGFRAVWSKK